MNTKILVRTALFTAIIAVVTLLVAIPIPGTKGYVNPSEAAIFLSSALLPSYGTFLAAGIGCLIADVASGYALYAPATFVVKGLEALLAYTLRKQTNMPLLLAFALSSLVMVLGYFLYETFIAANYQVAVLGIVPNIGQGLFGAAVAAIVCPLLKNYIVED